MGAFVSPLYRFPTGNRNRPLLPHRLLGPTRELLQAKAEMCRSYANEFNDERWERAARALDECADLLRDVSR